MAGRNRRSANRASQSDRSSVGVMDMARERPVAAVAIAAGAAAASLFLWSRRSQISTQLSNLGDQIGEWAENLGNGLGDDTAGLAISEPPNNRKVGGRPGTRRRLETNATGGRTADLDTHSGSTGVISTGELERGRTESPATSE
jgi:hypothetical protein